MCGIWNARVFCLVFFRSLLVPAPFVDKSRSVHLLPIYHDRFVVVLVRGYQLVVRYSMLVTSVHSRVQEQFHEGSVLVPVLWVYFFQLPFDIWFFIFNDYVKFRWILDLMLQKITFSGLNFIIFKSFWICSTAAQSVVILSCLLFHSVKGSKMNNMIWLLCSHRELFQIKKSVSLDHKIILKKRRSTVVGLILRGKSFANSLLVKLFIIILTSYFLNHNTGCRY